MQVKGFWNRNAVQMHEITCIVRVNDSQGKQGELKHLQCCTNPHNCQRLYDSNSPKEQHYLPAKKYKPNHIGYASEGMYWIGPWRGVVVKGPDL